MLIYALTGQVWTIQLIRAVPTILFWKTEPMEDSRVGDQHNTEHKNQQHRTTKDCRDKGENMVKTNRWQMKKKRTWRVCADMRGGKTCTAHRDKRRRGLPLSTRRIAWRGKRADTNHYHSASLCWCSGHCCRWTGWEGNTWGRLWTQPQVRQ